MLYRSSQLRTPVQELLIPVDYVIIWTNSITILLVAQLASAIRCGIASVDDVFIREAIPQMVTKTDREAYEFLRESFTISNLRNLGFYDLDFRPVLGRIYYSDIFPSKGKGVVWVLLARSANSP